MLNICRDELFAFGILGLILYSKTKDASIGKVTDSTVIRPYSRVDEDDHNRRFPIVNLYHPGKKKPLRWKKSWLVPNDAVKKFGLYSIEFGNWVTQNERVDFLFGITESLSNMVRVIPKFKSTNIGFEGELAIAIGARGRGASAAAFFQRSIWLINLTKTMGAGSLGHEWAHGLDSYLSWKYFKVQGFVSDGGHYRSTRKRVSKRLLNEASIIEHLFEKLFQIIFWKENQVPTEYHLFLLNQTEYYNRRLEVWARIMQGYFRIKFKEHGIKDNMTIRSRRYMDEPPAFLIRKAMPTINKILMAALS